MGEPLMTMATRALVIKSFWCRLQCPRGGGRCQFPLSSAIDLGEAVGILVGQLKAEPMTVGLKDLAAWLSIYGIDFADVRDYGDAHAESIQLTWQGTSWLVPGLHHGWLFLSFPGISRHQQGRPRFKSPCCGRPCASAFRAVRRAFSARWGGRVSDGVTMAS
jgi:hypothetical protein